MNISLQGSWTAEVAGLGRFAAKLPGTLDENGIGNADAAAHSWHPDIDLENTNEAFRTEEISTRFTRRHTYEGEARFTRRLEGGLWTKLQGEIEAGKRIFLDAERARVLGLTVDGSKVPDFMPPSISTAHCFEVTGLLREGSELTLISDNSYPGLPHDDIVCSSAATDETQTNWNGVLGYLRLRSEERTFLDSVRVYPKKNTLTVKAALYTDSPDETEIHVRCDALCSEAVYRVKASEPVTELVFEDLPLREDCERWDIGEGRLYVLEVVIPGRETKSVSFGVRDFGDNGKGRLALNGRTIFLRSEANCGEFPETGYEPTSVSEWEEILKRYRSYGINCVRFHSHCPPEGAFAAADRLGMLMQPELACWNPRDAFESEESFHYYRQELVQILNTLANHPSFVMLTLGNELQVTQKGEERMAQLLALAKQTDATRLYANGSNVHYGEKGCDENSDFYTSFLYYKHELRGTYANMEGYINQSYPSADRNFDAAMDKLREEYRKPVFEFEVGQFEVLPDFDELERFQGISDPANYRLIKSKAEKLGLMDDWKRYVEATGELSRIGYREEIEASMRTKEMSGISLLGLQDFPGQGTALVGMMNSHLEPKPFEFAKPEHFKSFFRESLPLVLLKKYTYETTEKLTAAVVIANFGRADIAGKASYELRRIAMDDRGYSLTGMPKEGEQIAKGELPYAACPAGELTEAGRLEIELGSLALEENARLNLVVRLGELVNVYPLWVYMPVEPVCPENVYETGWLDERAKAVLEEGGRVYLTPPAVKEAMTSSIKTQFTTDFWSVGTFPGQEGAMGQLIDTKHPIFREFPTEFHTNWQWWPMASQRAFILPKKYKAIVTEMDSYAFMRPMAQLLECRVGKGRLMLSSMDLGHLRQYPEARALQAAIYRYMASEEFALGQDVPEISVEELEGEIGIRRVDHEE